MIRYLVSRALVEMARNAEFYPLTPEEKAALQTIREALETRGEDEARQVAWAVVAAEVARMLADQWDQYGAPTTAKLTQGAFFAHFSGPKGERVVEASTKREAYRKARAAWIKDLLDP